MTGKGTLHARDIVEKGEVIALHIAAIVVGLILMIVGLAMGVSMVMLPPGIVIGLAGVAIFVWGFVGRSEKSRRNGQ
jgi:hypothetical protein